MEIQEKYDALIKKCAKLEEDAVYQQKLLNASNGKGLELKQELLMMQDLPQEFKIERAKMNFQIEQAGKFIASGAFPIMKAEQAYVLIKAGEEMKIPALQALNDLYIVKGAVRFHGKGLINRITNSGYKIEYIDESEKGVTVRVFNQEFDKSEVVLRSDPAFLNSKAIQGAPKNKMRYHGARMIVSFYLPFLVSAAQVWEEDDYLEANQPQKQFEANQPPIVQNALKPEESAQGLGFSEEVLKEEVKIKEKVVEEVIEEVKVQEIVVEKKETTEEENPNFA